MHNGRCKCGQVHYVIDGPIRKVVNCHCTICRTMNGGAYSTYVVIMEKDLTIRAGHESLGAYNVVGTAIKRFCVECGTPLYNVNPDRYPGAAMVYLGTLDDHKGLLPEVNIYRENQLLWVDMIGDAENLARGIEGSSASGPEGS